MNRPLLITDCDEVLLHMVRHFGEWLGSEHAIDFVPHPHDFANAMRRRETGVPVVGEEVWRLLDGFFTTEMHRQTLVPHVLEALSRIGEIADIVILTNVGDEHHARRVEQLDRVGIRHEVVCNQGGKGRRVRQLVKEKGAPVTVFVDDIAGHHESVAQHAPGVWRLHMVAERSVAPLFPPAEHAHARIDDWDVAADWVLDRMKGQPLPVAAAS